MVGIFKCPSRKYSKKIQTLTDFEKTTSASVYISVANFGNSNTEIQWMVHISKHSS